MGSRPSDEEESGACGRGTRDDVLDRGARGEREPL